MRQRDRYRIGKQPVRVATGYAPPAEVTHGRETPPGDLISTLARRADELRDAIERLERKRAHLDERIAALRAYIDHSTAVARAERVLSAHADLVPPQADQPIELPWLRSA